MVVATLLLLTAFFSQLASASTKDRRLLSSQVEEKAFLGYCFVYKAAFPHGPEAADLSQELCHLVAENTEGMTCDDITESFTGQRFIDSEVSRAQTDLCESESDLVDAVFSGQHPESSLVFETGVAECLYLINHEESSRARRALDTEEDDDDDNDDDDDDEDDDDDDADVDDNDEDDNVDGDNDDDDDDADDDDDDDVTEEINWVEFLHIFGVFALYAVRIFYYFAGRRRRALTAAATEQTQTLIQANHVMEECANGINSFMCSLPMNEFVDVFTTGICAGIAGLACVVSQDDILALAAPEN